MSILYLYTRPVYNIICFTPLRYGVSGATQLTECHANCVQARPAACAVAAPVATVGVACRQLVMPWKHDAIATGTAASTA